MIALYSESRFDTDDVKPVKILGKHANGQVICKETGRFYCGVFLADVPQVGILFRTSAPKKSQRGVAKRRPQLLKAA